MKLVKVLTIAGTAAAAMGAAIVITSRLSDEVMMTIVGVACGIFASIPVSIGLLMALTRERAYVVTEPETPQPFAPPPVIAADYWTVATPPPTHARAQPLAIPDRTDRRHLDA